MKHTMLPLFQGRNLTFDRTLVMGILNVNDDSFFEGSRLNDVYAVLARARAMIEDGADILDIGAESTRPGSCGLSAEDELSALIPAIAIARAAFPHIPISADTRKAEVARAALIAGADIVNDVSGLDLEDERDAMSALLKESGAAYVLMHTQGTPETMQVAPQYDDFMKDLCAFFERKIAFLTDMGVARERLILDPGIGFGKTPDNNLEILANLAAFKKFGLPVLIGASRKGFIGKVTTGNARSDPSERLEGTLAISALCAMKGIEMVRVHDVLENVRSIRMIDAIGGRGNA